MIPEMTPAQSRAAALLLLVATVGLIYLVVIHPVHLLYRGNAETIDQLNRQLIHYQQLGGRRPALEQEIHNLARSRPTDRYYLQNRTEALAAAELQARIGRIVAGADATLISTQPLATAAKELLPKVRVRVRMTADIAAIREILYALESSTPFLLVEEVSIYSQGRPVIRKTAKTQQRQLNVQFDLSGYIRSSAS